MLSLAHLVGWTRALGTDALVPISLLAQWEHPQSSPGCARLWDQPFGLFIGLLSRQLAGDTLGDQSFGEPNLSFSILRQKKGNVAYKHWVGPSNLVKCKPCPAAQSAMVCGSDGHTYTSKVSHLCSFILSLRISHGFLF